jgi:hypothetical protein
MNQKQGSSRYDCVPQDPKMYGGKQVPLHTGEPDCPACKMINEELTPGQHQELVDALMSQFDGIVDRFADRAKAVGRGVKPYLQDLLKDIK